MNQNAETELMLEGDDDAVSLLQEKEIDNLAGKLLIFLFVIISAHDVGEFEVNLLVNKLVPVVRTVLSHLNVNNLSHF